MTAQPDYAALVEQARAARERAYTPYSHFAVGAAVQTSTGRVFLGCNIENAAYPATVCAERVALLSAYAAGERAITMIAVIADTPGPVSPCGTCRQVLLELAPDCTVVLANLYDQLRLTTPRELLPDGFTSGSLPT